MEKDTRTEINPADYFSPDALCQTRASTGKYGIQRHLIAGSIGLLLGIQADRWSRRQAAIRDNIYYNYILSHPEDFPPIERKKYSEILEDWIPAR